MIRFPCHCDYVFELPGEKAAGLNPGPQSRRWMACPTLGDRAASPEPGLVASAAVHPMLMIASTG